LDLSVAPDEQALCTNVLAAVVGSQDRLTPYTQEAMARNASTGKAGAHCRDLLVTQSVVGLKSCGLASRIVAKKKTDRGGKA
jgi:hypothetical protein